MGLKPGQKNLTVTMSDELHDRIHALAKARDTKASPMVAAWLEAGSPEPLAATGEIRTVRSNNRELFVSIPQDFIARAGLAKGSPVRLSYSENRLILTAE